MSFEHIPRPVQGVVTMENGTLALVQDARNYYWIVNRLNGHTVRERFQTLDAARQEASTLLFLHAPKAPSPKWSAPVKGRAAQVLFARWPEK